ncbi:MAG: RNA pseudouridine synthase [Saprospiraceae bacterium]|nr:RNA pseudouridine synthase [Saprospiraceae bacterium]
MLFYENNDFIIARKPAGFLSEEDPAGSVNLRSLLEKYLSETYPWKKRGICQLVNRLDKPVEGLLICAKKQSILKGLQQQFYERTVRKNYFAIVEGKPEPIKATIKSHLKKVQHAFRAVAATANDPEAKEAILHYQLLDHQEGFSLLQIELRTGKFHQIRFQLSQKSYPIWNDEWYGAKKYSAEMKIGLFSYSIQFKDVQTGEQRNFVCCPPLDKEPWNLFFGVLSQKCQTLVE